MDRDEQISDDLTHYMKATARLRQENANLRTLIAEYIAGQRANREHTTRIEEDLRNARAHIKMIEARLKKEV